MIDVEAKIGEVLNLVQEADKAVMAVYDSDDFKVEEKADGSPVTKADLASNEILLDGLKRLFPSVPIISEEGKESENTKIVSGEQFWLVDPLDGTNEFLARSGHFTICAALIEDNEPSFGIVSAPALGITYYGGPGMGSFRRKTGEKISEPIHVATTKTGILLVSPSILNKATADYIAKIYPHYEIKAIGSQLKLPVIAEGKAD